MRWRVIPLLMVGAMLAPAAAWAASGGAGFGPRIISVGSGLTRVLHAGNRGADVKTLQAWLNEVGYQVPETGYFGPIAKEAVRNFQALHSIRPCGAVGARTASALVAVGVYAFRGSSSRAG